MKTRCFKATRYFATPTGKRALSIRVLFIALFLLVTTSIRAPAVDGIWLPDPGSGDWNTGTNWSTSPLAPVNPSDTATFNTSATTSLTLSANVAVESITFNPRASSFTIDTNGHELDLGGAGIVDNSGTTQTILNSQIGGGTINFNNSATAGDATIYNYPSPAIRPNTINFNSTSTAGSATIYSAGAINFNSTSTAGSATITNTDGGATNFTNTSTAGSATIINNFGTTNFTNTSTAGSATIINYDIGTLGSTLEGVTFFRLSSTAGSATITNYGSTTETDPGSTEFADASSAGNANINNNGSGVGEGGGGTTMFTSTSSAGNATIINYAGASGNGGAAGGSTEFADASSAGNATIINYGGTGGGLGGSTLFIDSSNGGTATAITNGNGIFDISGLTMTGMQIGSIAGSGNYFLGSKTLIVGGNNLLSSTVSGVIQDGGMSGGTGGSLTKVGTGTLILTGANTYSGGTNLNGGIVAVNMDANLGTGPLSFNGGTLEALAAGGGIVSGKAITLNSAGGTFLADAGTVSTLSGVISGTGSWTKTGAGTLTLSGTNTYTGPTIVSAGVLQAGSAGAFSAGSAFTVNTGAVLDLNGFNNVAGSLSGSGLVTNIGGVGGLSNATLTVGADNTSTTFSGVLQNGMSLLALTKVGAGTLTLTGANIYSGGTNLNGGILAVNVDANLGTGPLSFNGGTLEALATGGGIVSGKAITLNSAGGAFLADAGTASTLSGVIAGTGSWTKAGSGTLILTGANSYSGGTTISAGTLQLGDGGATGSISGSVIDDGALVFDRSDSVNFAGVIGGTGAVSQNGAGTLTLTAVNTYRGGTNLNGGTLAVNSDGNLGTGALSFNGGTLEALATGGGLVSSKAITLNSAGGTFLADAGTASTLSGVIAGTGSWTKSGVGTLTLTGANIYSGGTNLNGGTLAINSDANLGTGPLSFNGGTLEALAAGGGIVSSKAITLNSAGGTFLADAGTASTLSGVIIGTGSWTKSGLGTLTLTGANIYSGGTNLNGGTLAINSDANLGTGPLTFNGGTLEALATGGGIVSSKAITLNSAGGTFLADAGTASTLSGVITGTGSWTKSGLGTLTLTGANTYTGTTTVNAGSLIVDGSIVSAQTLVGAAGLLGGHGSLAGNLVNSGIVSPGDSPGTLTVGGNYTQSAGGTLRIEVAGLAAGQHDLLAVSGHANLAGTLQLIALGGFKLQVGNQLTFLTATGGVSGSFSTVQNQISTGTIVNAQVVDLPNAVVLEGTQGSFATTPGVAITPNEVAVAKALDSAIGDPREAALFAFLNSQPIANLPNDLALIAPEEVSSIFNIGVSVANVQAVNLLRRMEDIRMGSTGFSSAGFALNGGEASFGDGFAGPPGPEGKSGPAAFAPTPENRWGAFITGSGEFTSVDSTSNASGYDVDTGGFTLGVDYRVCPNFAIGLTAGYAHPNVGLDNGGTIGVNVGEVGFYSTVFGNGLYLDTAINGGPTGYNIQRTALQGAANGSTEGWDFNFLVAAGYDWKKGNLTIGPTASFQFSYIGLNGFTETGSLAPLKYPNQNTESERSAIGAKATYEWKIGHVTVIPQLDLAWQHEYGDQAYSVVAGFASGAGTNFTVNGPEIGRDSLLIGAGASVLLSERVSVYAYYDGELARTNYQSNTVTAGVRIAF
jgi:autotransporter-associated beta strand protein